MRLITIYVERSKNKISETENSNVRISETSWSIYDLSHLQMKKRTERFHKTVISVLKCELMNTIRIYDYKYDTIILKMM